MSYKLLRTNAYASSARRKTTYSKDSILQWTSPRRVNICQLFFAFKRPQQNAKLPACLNVREWIVLNTTSSCPVPTQTVSAPQTSSKFNYFYVLFSSFSTFSATLTVSSDSSILDSTSSLSSLTMTSTPTLTRSPFLTVSFPLYKSFFDRLPPQKSTFLCETDIRVTVCSV